MPSTYTNDLRIEEQATGENSGTWGTKVNSAFSQIAEAFSYGTQDCFSSDADATTTVADGATDPARAMYFKITSSATLTATRTLTIAPNTISRVMFIENATTGSQSIAISQGSGANVTIETGKTKIVYLDGAGATAAVVDAMAKVDPGVNDTLAEILAAGNTTGGTDISVSTGDDITFADSSKVIFGAGSDLQIYSDGTTGKITGNVDVTGTVTADGLTVSNSSLQVKLEEADGTYNPRLVTYFDSSGTHLQHTWSSGATNLIFEAGGSEGSGTERMRIDGSTGNVGIGTSNPSVATHTVGKVRAQKAGQATAYVQLSANELTSNYAADIFLNDTGLTFKHNSNSRGFVFDQNGTERMRIDSSGLVDIGSNGGASDGASKQLLTLVNPSGTASAAARLWMSGTNGSSRGAYIEAQAQSTANNHDLIFATSASSAAPTEAMRIASSSRVGIGVTNPLGQLQVSGATAPSTHGGIVFVRNTGATSSNTTFGGIHFSSSPGTDFSIGKANVNTTTTLSFRNGNTGAALMDIDPSGNVGIGTNSPATDLHIKNSGSTQLLLESGNTDTGFLLFGDAQDLNIGSVSYNHSDNSMRFETDDLERMRIDSSGNVGIGATNPSAFGTLLVQGTATQLALNASSGKARVGFFENGTGRFYIDTLNGSDGLAFVDADGSSERMRIDSSGNLLVGTTTAAVANGTTAGIAATSGNQLLVGTSSDVSAVFNRITDDGNIVLFRKNGTTVGSIGTEGGNLTIDGATATGKSGIEFSGAEWLPRDGGANTDGAISLGDSSNRFNNLYLSGVAYNGDGSASAPSISFGADTNTGFYRIGSDQIGFVTGGSLRAKIDASGDVFIGRTSSGNTGNGHTIRGGDSAIFSRDASGETMQIGRNANDGDLIRLYKNGTQVGSVSVSGSTTAYNTSSDQRLKENIVDAPSAADDIDAIQVRSWDWKADGSHQKYGMVAQELVTVAPSAVSQPEDPEEMMGVDYSKLVPMLIKEVQQLRARVAQLEGAN